MHNQFHFKLSNDRLSKYTLQSRSMHIMASILLIIYALPYTLKISEDWMMVIGILLPAITILIISLFKKTLLADVNNNRVFRILEIGFLIMGSMHYLQINQNLPALLFGAVSIFMGFLLWMESRILHDQYILFDRSKIEIELPLSTKKYQWQELQAVMIKNEFITLSFKDNKIHQVKIKPNFVENEEGDFLFFCQDCIRN
ncbi:MAG TPA: hypothetical protein PLU17_12200 [Chitinophagaceae bacterium]|nr:hypothetical protein [Chitinophagaceae bacterium]